MAKKILSGIILAMIVLGVSMLASNAMLVKASGSIYDVNGDGKVDIKDLAIVAKAFGACGPNFWYPGSPASQNWNASYDFSGSGQINMVDLVLLAKHFGTVS